MHFQRRRRLLRSLFHTPRSLRLPRRNAPGNTIPKAPHAKGAGRTSYPVRVYIVPRYLATWEGKRGEGRGGAFRGEARRVRTAWLVAGVGGGPSLIHLHVCPVGAHDIAHHVAMSVTQRTDHRHLRQQREDESPLDSLVGTEQRRVNYLHVREQARRKAGERMSSLDFESCCVSRGCTQWTKQACRRPTIPTIPTIPYHVPP